MEGARLEHRGRRLMRKTILQLHAQRYRQPRNDVRSTRAGLGGEALSPSSLTSIGFSWQRNES